MPLSCPTLTACPWRAPRCRCAAWPSRRQSAACQTSTGGCEAHSVCVCVCVCVRVCACVVRACGSRRPRSTCDCAAAGHHTPHHLTPHTSPHHTHTHTRTTANRRVFALLAKLGLGDEPITMRMTGCPNGCARPYMAEIGWVGDGPNSYQVRRAGGCARRALRGTSLGAAHCVRACAWLGPRLPDTAVRGATPTPTHCAHLTPHSSLLTRRRSGWAAAPTRRGWPRSTWSA
jgi:hypothetical protein